MIGAALLQVPNGVSNGSAGTTAEPTSRRSDWAWQIFWRSGWWSFRCSLGGEILCFGEPGPAAPLGWMHRGDHPEWARPL